MYTHVLDRHTFFMAVCNTSDSKLPSKPFFIVIGTNRKATSSKQIIILFI